VECAFLRNSPRGSMSSATSHLRLPGSPRLKQVAVIELVDLDRPEELASTSAAAKDRRLVLEDANGRTVLPRGARVADLPYLGRDLRCLFQRRSGSTRPGFPALRLIDAAGRRLLTMPVAREAAAANP
jgi:hypothetical protein